MAGLHSSGKGFGMAGTEDDENDPLPFVLEKVREINEIPQEVVKNSLREER